MGVYISIHPTDGKMTQDEVALALQGAGFQVSRAFDAEGREIEFGTEPADRVYLDADEVEVERNGEFCHAWWRLSSGMGASYYESVLDSKLHLAERLGWRVTGGGGEYVTRENFEDHVLRFAGEASKLRQMFGVAGAMQAGVESDQRDPIDVLFGISESDELEGDWLDGADPETIARLDEILRCSEDAEEDDADGHQPDPPEPGGVRDAD